MPRPRVSPPSSVRSLVDGRGGSLRSRLYRGLKDAIQSGELASGSRLPSSRVLAESLGVSRSTVVDAFDLLAAEGFVDRWRGSGTYVSRLFDLRDRTQRPVGDRRPSRRGQALPPGGGSGPGTFTPCEPDAEAFPHPVWARLLARHARVGAAWPAHPGGLPALREAIAGHLTLSRGVRASAEQVLVVSGAVQGLWLAGQVLLDPGDEIWFEDPGFPDGRTALAQAGVRPVPVPVDGDGLDVVAGQRLAPLARAAYVTPSHQFPTGAVMGLKRRLRLLEWAARTGGWVVEDDYDSEFCYDGRPLPALQGLDEHETVVYVGTLNKVAFRGMRIGYLVVPPSVAGTFATATAAMSLAPPAAVQAALADFITDGHLAKHIIRTCARYAERRAMMVAELRQQLGSRVTGPPIGMHMLAPLPGVPVRRVAQRGRASGMDLRTLSSYACATTAADALLLGYTHIRPEQIQAAVGELARLVRQC